MGATAPMTRQFFSCAKAYPYAFGYAKSNKFRMGTCPIPLVLLHGHTPTVFSFAKSNRLCMGTHPMPSVLPKTINFAWARAECLQFC